MSKRKRSCRRCGCTDARGCQPFSCYWVPGVEDICSECATGEELAQARRSDAQELARRSFARELVQKVKAGRRREVSP